MSAGVMEIQGELAALKARLEDAEETLEAIRMGQVDALVVHGPHGDQVYTLKGAQEPYRLLVERMQEGALTIAPDGTVLYSNRRFAELLGVQLEALVGTQLSVHFHAKDKPEFQRMLEVAAGGPVRREVSFVRKDRSLFPALVSVNALPIDGISGLSVIVTDITDHKRAQEIEAAERFTRSILEQLTDPVIVCDRDGRITNLSRAAEQLAAAPSIGVKLGEAFRLRTDRADTAGSGCSAADIAEEIVKEAVRGKTVQGVEVRLAGGTNGGQHFLFSAGPLLSRDQKAIGCIVTLTDITPRKRFEEQQRILLAELNHRVKNNLAVVYSIAMQTLRNSTDLASFSSAFEGRLNALSLAHNVLTQSGWQRADLKTLAEQVLAPYRAADDTRAIRIDGPPVSISPQFVLPLSLVFHELATNSAKYGALSTSTGELTVAWTLDAGGAAEPLLALSWTERNGPKVVRPERAGFGTTLINYTIAYELDGEVALDYREDGLVCALKFLVRRADGPVLAG
ncbi:MAG: putative signal transduction histidine kinase with domain [Rhodospirillales bacterium]|nr:putative signal transduction histidine kinase with domain [Rhodospirillales bacterium]